MENRKKAIMEDGSREKNRVEDECRESANSAIEWESERQSERVAEW